MTVPKRYTIQTDRRTDGKTTCSPIS